MSTKTDTTLTEAERRVLLELYVELSSVDPSEHPQGSPHMQPLSGVEVGLLQKLLANTLVGR